MPNRKELALGRLRRVAEAVVQFKTGGEDCLNRFLELQERAKLALQESKLGRGNPVNLPEARKIAAKRLRETRDEHRGRILPIIAEIRASGINSYRGIAAELDKRGIKPQRAEKWSSETIRKFESGE
jgi:hypothetical protein